MGGSTLHADDTPVPVLAPGAGTGRLWTYVRDACGHGGAMRPAVLFRYAPHRKAERPAEHLARSRGDRHADSYAGFERLYGEQIAEVAYWAHVRRKFYDVQCRDRLGHRPRGAGPHRGLYAVEGDARGPPPDERRCERQARAGPLLDAFRRWLDRTLPKLSRRSDLATSIRYALARWPALTRYVADGGLEIDNNAAERLPRGIAIGRKNWPSAGSDQSGHRVVSIYSLVETVKLNSVDPEPWLTDAIARIADHPARHVADLIPWKYRPA